VNPSRTRNAPLVLPNALCLLAEWGLRRPRLLETQAELIGPANLDPADVERLLKMANAEMDKVATVWARRP
jgi:hypothetical protein